MSTKIVSTESKPLNGEINKKDLVKIHTEYIKHVKLESTDGRPLKKGSGFYIDIAILKAFIQQAEAAGPDFTQLLLQFGITLPDQKTCSKPYKDISNTLTATFLIADGKGKIKDKTGDGVLTAGFKAAQSFSPKITGAKIKMTTTTTPPDLTCCGLPTGGGN